VLGPERDADDRLSTCRDRGLALMLAPLLTTAATDTDGALLARVAEALLAIAELHPQWMRFGSFSFRSHAEAFFHWAGPFADYRALFDNRMGKDRAVLEELVRRTDRGDESGPAAQWRQAFAACMQEFHGRIGNEDLEMVTPPSGPGRGPSPFHAAVAASGVIDELPPWFAAYRLTINLFYQLLPALDLSARHRFYLCHALAGSIDAVFGETWQERLAALEAHLAVVA
jgi:hypothetical protein